MNQGPLLERRSPLRITYALLILTIFFFLLPSGFRAARLSLGQKENDVKDWLPSDFPETAELDWFADHFAGESFVLATWPGCTSGDQRLKLLSQKLKYESATFDPSADFPLEVAQSYARAKQVGSELQLLHTGDNHLDWGGRNEKWLRSASGTWYFITPDGRLYRWDESANGPAAGIRVVLKSLGRYELRGQLVTAFGQAGGSRLANPFYNDTSILCAPLFETVQTGDSIVEELAQEGGPLWPIDLTEEDKREVVARRLAMQRLTGTLFAPAVSADFGWTVDAFRSAVPAARRDELPVTFDESVDQALTQILEDQYDGSLERLKSDTLDGRTAAWYTVFDSAGVEPPPRLTCVLVTLTDLAKDNLTFALGRGTLGEPRGRLLTLAAESGVQPAGPPSMAPPPFNQTESESLSGLPPLRMGGPPVDNMAIDEEGTVTLVRLVGYSVIVGVVLSYLCFSSIKITVMVFVVGGSSAMLSMAIVWWTSGRVDAILLSMPSLVYVLGLSGAIHVINYYRDEVRAGGEVGAAGRALRHALLPCTLASVTTAIGLISLFTSNLAPISNFGLYAAIGVIMTLAVLFSYLPAALQTFKPRVDKPAAPDVEGQAADPTLQGQGESRLADWWAGVGRWIATHHAAVSIVCLVALLVGAIGLKDIKTSVQLLKLFDEDSRIIHDYAWLENNFGKLVPMELVVRMPPTMQAEQREADGPGKDQPNGPRDTSIDRSLTMIERVEAVARIRSVVYRTLGEPGRDIVGQATGADTFLPPLPAISNSYNPIRAKYNRELIEAGNTLRDNDYLRIEKAGPYAKSELWRISIRVAALSDVDYGRFITTLREAVEPVLRAYDTRDELLKTLADRDEGGEKKRRGSPRVLVVGSERPSPLAETELLTADAIDARATFIATLGELLRGERIEKPEWLNVDAAKASELTTNAQWDQVVKKFDAVIWLGNDSFEPEDFAAAEHFVDAEAIRHRIVQPTLLPGRIPDVTGSGAMQVIYTGVVPVVYKAQRTLLGSLADSMGLAFVLIAAVMIFLLNPGRPPMGWFIPRHFASGTVAGLIAMIPNVFPVLFVFGVMCHLGIEIDIGTMMTASVAMGVAVDDTIHFLTWFREHLDRGMNRVDAVIETYRRVGPAMTQTTIVGGLGLFVFALSTFTPTQRFGTLMLIMLAAALVGDLILLPALLAGPAGKWFKPRTDERGRPLKSAVPAPAAPVVSADDFSADDAEESEEKRAEIPHLKVHFPNERTDAPHRLKRK